MIAEFSTLVLRADARAEKVKCFINEDTRAHVIRHYGAKPMLLSSAVALEKSDCLAKS